MRHFHKWFPVVAALAMTILPGTASAQQCKPSATISVANSPVVRADGETEVVGEVDINNINVAGCFWGNEAFIILIIQFPVNVTNLITDTNTGATDVTLTNTASGDVFYGAWDVTGLAFTIPGSEPLPATAEFRITNIRLDAAQQGGGSISLMGYSAGVGYYEIDICYPMTVTPFGSLSVAQLNASDAFSATPAPLSYQQCAGKDAPSASTAPDFTMQFQAGSVNSFKTLSDEGVDATQGTRLYSTFTNLPGGANVWITAGNAGGSDAYSAAYVGQDKTAGGFGNAPAAPSSGYVKLLPATDGSFTSVWEITDDANAAQYGTVTFGVYVSCETNATGPITVAGGLAPLVLPDPDRVSATAPLPRFASDSNANLGSMAQIASAGGWDTTLTLVNLGPVATGLTLNYFGNDGSASQLPLTFPQLPPGNATVTASVAKMLVSNATLIIDTTGPGSQTSVADWTQLLTTGAIDGFAILEYAPTGQEAVVPFETRNASSYLLAFDNTGQVGTGLAIANLAPSAASVGVILRDDTGTQIGKGSIALAPLGHESFMLTDASNGFPVTANKRGTAEFDTPLGGRVSVLGLRANGEALTTLPVLADVGNSGGAMAQAASGGGWQTTFTLVNTGSTAASATLSFFANDGTKLSLPLSFPQTGQTANEAWVTQIIPAGGTLIIVTQGPASGATVTGSAILATTGNVGGFAIYQNTAAGQETVVPLENRYSANYLLAFDNANKLATGVALSNITNAPVTVSAILRDDTSKQIGTDAITLAANSHAQFMLAGQYAYTANLRGTIEFDTPLGGQIAVIGIRATPAGAYTTIPAMAK